MGPDLPPSSETNACREAKRTSVDDRGHVSAEHAEEASRNSKKGFSFFILEFYPIHFDSRSHVYSYRISWDMPGHDRSSAADIFKADDEVWFYRVFTFIH